MSKRIKTIFYIIITVAILLGIKAIKETFQETKISPEEFSGFMQQGEISKKEINPPATLESTLPKDTQNHPQAVIKKLTKDIYQYTYQDLGIRITTNPYENFFLNDPQGNILQRHGNKIFKTNTRDHSPDYIEVFFKDPKTSFEEEIKNKHLPAGDIILTGTQEKDEGLFGTSCIGFQKIDIASADGNLATNPGYTLDKEIPSNTLSIVFFMNPEQPDRYYKFSYGDCAPGPCSIFGKIDFF